MNGMKKKISFCIAYTLQIRLGLLLDYGMLQSHFHMKLMVCRHLPPALEKRHFSAEQERQWCATRDVMQGLVPARGFISWFSPLIEEERRRTYHQNQLVTMKTSTRAAFSGTWLHSAGWVWGAASETLRVFRAELIYSCTDPDFVTLICCFVLFFQLLILMNNSRW